MRSSTCQRCYFVRAGAIPRTSSGKFQRTRCQQLFQDAAIKTVWASHRQDHANDQETQDDPELAHVEAALSAIWASHAGSARHRQPR